MTSAPQGLLVDCGGTLLHPDPDVARQYRTEARRLIPGESLPDLDTVRARFRAAFERPGLPEGSMRYGTTRPEGYFFWKRVVGGVFPALTDDRLSVLTDRLYERFAEPDAWAVRPNAREVLEGLRTHGVRTALVSNWDRRGPRLLARMGLEAFFDSRVFSCEVGVEKPDPEIFREALRRLSVPPEKTVMLGNSPSHDLRPARKLGMRPRRFGTGEPGDTWTSVETWSRLPEVLGGTGGE